MNTSEELFREPQQSGSADEPLEGVIVQPAEHAPVIGPTSSGKTMITGEPVSRETADPEAPYGWMVDRKTGERRPRLRPPYRATAAAQAATHADGTPPSLDELKAQKRDAQPDVAPGKPKGKSKWRKGKQQPGEPEPEYPPFRAGPIAKGVNRLYFKAGKLLKLWDKPLGFAVISVTRKVDEEDVTVGEAWEEIARTNPRIRVVLLKLISGNQWAQLFTAHLPILIAVAMKDGVREHLPFGGLLEAFLDDEPEDADEDEDAGPMGGLSAMLGGLDPATAAQMAGIAQGLMANITVPRGGLGVPRMPDASGVE